MLLLFLFSAAKISQGTNSANQTTLPSLFLPSFPSSFPQGTNSTIPSFLLACLLASLLPCFLPSFLPSFLPAALMIDYVVFDAYIFFLMRLPLRANSLGIRSTTSMAGGLAEGN